jgi:hypothetical protein
MNNQIVAHDRQVVKPLAIDAPANNGEAAEKRRIRRQLDLTRHGAFKQGDMCFTWSVYQDAPVELRYRFGIGWKCQCKALDAETVLQNQPPEDLDIALREWINGLTRHPDFAARLRAERPAVADLAKRYNISNETAREMYEERV